MQNSKLQVKSKKNKKLLNFELRFCLLTFAFLLTFIFSIFSFSEARAATAVYFDLETPVIYEGDTFLVNLRISTPDKLVNVVDGAVLYDNNKLEIKEVSTGNSLFALWPKPPVFSNESGTLTFVGGVLDGFQGEKGEVFKVVFLAKSEGEAHIDFRDGFSVFLHDGLGTKISALLRPLSFNISKRPSKIPIKDAWRDLLEKDTTQPEFVEAIISRSPDIFDNQYFVSFFAVDGESGIAYYEIKEGERDFVRAESPRLLQDQSLKSIVQIKSADEAGNESIVTPELAPVPIPGILYKTYLIWIFVTLAILAVIFWLWRRRYPTNRH